MVFGGILSRMLSLAGDDMLKAEPAIIEIVYPKSFFETP